MECPHPESPFLAEPDISNDGNGEYIFFRAGKIAYRYADGSLARAPPVMPQDVFARFLDNLKTSSACWSRGTLSGTSVIQPNILGELLPLKT